VKISQFSIGIILVIVIAVAFAGCSSTGQSAPATGAPAQGASAPAGSSAPAAGSVVSGASIFGAATPYNWIEYKTTTSGMTTYMKMEKSGKCTMRMEGKDLPGGSMTIDCTSKGGQPQAGQAQSNPNDIKPDVKYTFVGIEPVTVPAGTYATASKYSITSQGQTMYYWTAPGVPGFVKMQTNAAEGAIMELNGWG
jgi:uncharacterized protein YceK